MKKRRWFVTLMVSLLTMAMMAGCSSGGSDKTETPTQGQQSTNETKAEKKKKEKMVCNIDGEPAFYAYGYDVAVAQKLADQLGMDLEIHKVEWSSIGISMDAGDYDCIIAGMGRTAEREMAYSFTDPYYYRDNCVVVKADGPFADVKGLSELAGKGCKVTTQLGTGWIPLLDQIEGGITGSNYETTSECFMAVSNGVADVCIVDLPTAESALLTNKDLKIITFAADDTFKGDEEMVNVCIATRKSDTALRDKLQGAMTAIGWNDKAKMDELMNKVIGQQPAAN